MITEMNEAGVNFLCAREGFRSCPYLDSEGIPTIGIGTTIYPDNTRVTLNDSSITEDQAMEYVHDYLQQIYNWLLNNLKWKPNQNQFNALCSFLYNTGIGNRFNSYIHTQSAIINGDLYGICAGMLSVNNNGLLTTRRELEVKLFNS